MKGTAFEFPPCDSDVIDIFGVASLDSEWGSVQNDRFKLSTGGRGVYADAHVE
jgi:hypothetical protein